MANRDIQPIQFVLHTWHIIPPNKNELNGLIRYLQDNLKIRIELNSFTPENTDLETNKTVINSLSATEASAYIISGGVESSRVTCAHLAESKLPMFRFVKGE